MISVELNPDWLDPLSHAAFLAQGFKEPWSQAAHDWYVARDFDGMKNDVLVRVEGSKVLACVSLCYREVAIGEGPPIAVCIASAGTTYPTERRRGHYAALLEAALPRSRQRGCAALIGFVTRDNASGRGLLRTGARALPSFYIVSRARRACARRARVPAASRFARRATIERAQADGDRRWSEVANASYAHFCYRRSDEWLAQFVHRPNTVRVIRLAHDAVALVEEVGSTDRLQWLSCPEVRVSSSIASLAASSAAAGRQFFMYTLDPLQAQRARRIGLALRGGYMMLQPTGGDARAWNQLASVPWRVQSGDRL